MNHLAFQRVSQANTPGRSRNGWWPSSAHWQEASSLQTPSPVPPSCISVITSAVCKRCLKSLTATKEITHFASSSSCCQQLGNYYLP